MLRGAVAFVALLIASAMVLVLRPAEDAVPVLHELEPAAFEVLDVAAAADSAAAPRSVHELRARIAQVLVREQVPGVAIALVDREGVLYSGGVGVRDLVSGELVDGDTIFRVASITKGFVGLGVARMVEQGRLSLEQPIAELMPELPVDNPWHAEVPVTLAHALEHTAGFDEMRPSETFVDDDAMTVADALAINPRSRIVRWRPGSRFSYSNVGYSVAARAIELVAGEPFDAWLRREVLLPLGMRDSAFARSEALNARLATGYHGPGEPARFVPIAHRPAGALLSSSTELAQLVLFWLRRGEGFVPIVSSEALARIERSATLDYPALGTDYGLGNYGDVAHPVRARGHDGGLPGFHSALRYFPELGIGYVVLLNSTHSPRAMGEIRRLLLAYLTAERELPPMPEIPSTPPPAPEAGFFAFASPRSELFGFVARAITGWRLELEDDRARLVALGGGSIPLVPTMDGGWRHPAQSGTTVRIARDTDGDEVLVHHGMYAESGSWSLARARLWTLGLTVFVLGLAPWLGLVLLAVSLVRRRTVVPIGLAVWPAVAGLAFIALPRLVSTAYRLELLGTANVWTLAICASTLLLGVAAAAALSAALRSWTARERPHVLLRVPSTLAAVAAFAMTVWLTFGGVMGLRTWAW